MKRLIFFLPLLIFTSAGAADLESAIPASLQPLESFGKITRHKLSDFEELLGEDADLYLRFGMKEAVSAVFRHPEDQSRTVTVILGTMPSELAAYGLFVSYYFPVEGEGNLGNGGMVNEPQAYFWHGTTFALFKASGPEETRAGDLLRAATAVASLLGPPPPRPPVLEAFESVIGKNMPQYVPDHLLENPLFPPGLTGTADGTGYFLSIQEVRGSRIIQEYRKTLADAQSLPWPELEGVWGDDEELGPVTIAEKDDRLVGAMAAPGIEGMKEMLLRLVEISPDGR